jgi:hypothetical protein
VGLLFPNEAEGLIVDVDIVFLLRVSTNLIKLKCGDGSLYKCLYLAHGIVGR